jgi:hypothetical protein
MRCCSLHHMAAEEVLPSFCASTRIVSISCSEMRWLPSLSYLRAERAEVSNNHDKDCVLRVG